MRVTSPAADEAVAALARRQHGAISIAQLRAAGLGPHAVAARVDRGWLRRLHRGVYAVGPVESALTGASAALLGAAGEAALSHRTAAVIWRLLPARPADPVDLTLLNAGGSKRRGVRVHHAALTPPELRQRHGLRLTAPARTLLDLAATSPGEVEEALNEARILRLVTAKELASLLDRCPRHRGARALREAIGPGPDLTRSEAERRLLDLVWAAGLPAPRTNVRVAGHEVDLYWPRHNLVVEFDGWAYHSSRAAFERDRRRDADLQLAGLRVLRVTHRMLTRGRDALIARLAIALHARANVNTGIEGADSNGSGGIEGVGRTAA
jgi:very-short-patch-repair endonuclease